MFSTCPIGKTTLAVVKVAVIWMCAGHWEGIENEPILTSATNAN